MDHVSSNRQAMADMAEIARIAREIEEKRNNNRVLDLDMRVMMLITEWMGGPYVKNPLRPLGPTLERARRAQRVSKLSTREIGRARRYFAGLIGRYADKPTAIREAFQERIAAVTSRLPRLWVFLN